VVSTNEIPRGMVLWNPALRKVREAWATRENWAAGESPPKNCRGMRAQLLSIIRNVGCSFIREIQQG
jgi:hypothetical protein